MSHSALGLFLLHWGGAEGVASVEGQYSCGPVYFPSQVNVSVYNRLELRNSSNVLGFIRGAVEPGERPLPVPCAPGAAVLWLLCQT